MSSARTIRDPVLDHLMTPQNSAMDDYRLSAAAGLLGNIERPGHTRPECRVHG